MSRIFPKYYRVRNVKFARNLKFATSKTLVNFMKKMMISCRNWYFSVQKAIIYYTFNKSHHNSFILLVFLHVANFRYVANFRFLTLTSSFGQALSTYKERSVHCSHQIALGGYYGFRFVTPSPPQCVERFHRYRSYEKNIIARHLSFAGYIHNHKILPGNIFVLILKNKMAVTSISSTFSKEFCWPSRTKGIIGRDLKFAGYIHHYNILTGKIFGLILDKMAAMGVSLSVMKSACISLIIGPRTLVCKPTYRKSWAGNLLMWSDLILGSSSKVKRG